MLSAPEAPPHTRHLGPRQHLGIRDLPSPPSTGPARLATHFQPMTRLMPEESMLSPPTQQRDHGHLDPSFEKDSWIGGRSNKVHSRPDTQYNPPVRFGSLIHLWPSGHLLFPSDSVSRSWSAQPTTRFPSAATFEQQQPARLYTPPSRHNRSSHDRVLQRPHVDTTWNSESRAWMTWMTWTISPGTSDIVPYPTRFGPFVLRPRSRSQNTTVASRQVPGTCSVKVM